MKLSREQQRLVEDNLALVHTVIRDRVRGASNIGIFTYEDLYQIGCIGLCKAAYTDKYTQDGHSESTARFSTYAYRLIWNEICTMLTVATRARAELATDPDDMPAFMEPAQTHIEDTIAGAETQLTLKQVFSKAIQSAPGVTAKGIQALAYKAEGYTSTEIGMMMGGVSCHNVTAWVSKARKYLKSDPELVELLSAA